VGDPNGGAEFSASTEVRLDRLSRQEGVHTYYVELQNINKLPLSSRGSIIQTELSSIGRHDEV
jgi:hypothetical protein